MSSKSKNLIKVPEDDRVKTDPSISIAMDTEGRNFKSKKS